MEEQKIDKLIEQAINRVGKEKDERDIATLQEFLYAKENANKIACKKPLIEKTTKPSSKIKHIWLSITSIAAIVAIVFSLNIYRNNLEWMKHSAHIILHWNMTLS